MDTALQFVISCEKKNILFFLLEITKFLNLILTCEHLYISNSRNKTCFIQNMFHLNAPLGQSLRILEPCLFTAVFPSLITQCMVITLN